MKNTEVEKEVIKILESRWKKGRETYGVGISENQHPDILGWLKEAIEECADQLQYLVAMKVMLEKEKR